MKRTHVPAHITTRSLLAPTFMSTTPASHNACLLRVELNDFKPAIYRDVLVAPDITLRALHKVIQAAMGWDDAHLYAFAQPLRASESFWQIPNERKWQKPTPDDWGGEPMGNNDAKVKLSQLLTAPKQRLLYLYDFGDEWLHTVTLTAFSTTAEPLPHLLKAQNGCPPEDCGGPPGAEYWAAAWYDSAHEEHETARDMFGDQEPGSLDFATLQKAVAKLKKPARKRA